MTDADTIVIWQIIHKLKRQMGYLAAVAARHERQIADITARYERKIAADGVRIAALEKRVAELERERVTDETGHSRYHERHAHE